MNLEEIRAQIARIAELTKDELSELKTAILAMFNEIDEQETTPENTTILNELVAGGTAIQTREAEIKAAEDQAAADKEAARKAMKAISGEADPEDEEEESEDDGGEGTPVEDEVPAEPALTASRKGSSPSKMSSKVSKITPSEVQPQRASLVAASSGGGYAAGYAFKDQFDLAQFIAERVRRMGPETAGFGKMVLASADFRPLFSDDFKLGNDDSANMVKIDKNRSRLAAMVASGGTSLPANVDYTLPTFAEDDRPIKQALDQYQTDRGALTFRQALTLASVANSAGVWMEATDASPSGATKNLYTVPVPSSSTVYVNAITSRLQIGNFMGQFDPETVASTVQLAAAMHARTAELELLTLLNAACTQNITSAKTLGASRDWFTTIEQVCANLRYTHRLNANVILQVFVPEYVKNMIRADRVNEAAHDATAVDPYGITDEWIEAQLALRGIEPVWIKDALPISSGVYPTQQFSGFTASTAVPAFPTAIVWNVCIKGTMQFLDAGILDVGLIRDSILNQTNDLQYFSETFEGLAFRGFTGGALQIVSTMTPNGDSRTSVV